jgi:hypothetical protein
MPTEIALWRVDEAPLRVHPASIQLESKLEDIIESDPAMLGESLLIIGRQVKTDSGKIVDLLGIDGDGAIRVLELKRDRTPRDVVAQVLDYGSWVERLTNEQIRDLYEHHRGGHGSPNFDQAFEARFGVNPPETLNDSHQLTVIASDMDAATERIVTYLTGYGVPINVLFFTYYQDAGHKYIARTWMIDDAQVKAGNPSSGSKKRETWNGHDWYVNYGEYPGGRMWTDAQHYGFVAAGGAPWYSNTLRQLPIDARIFVYMPKTGYVGVGTVVGSAMPFKDAELDIDGKVTALKSLELAGTYVHDHDAKGEEHEEWIVPVSWMKTVDQSKALSAPGLFANQNSACKLRNQFTIDELTQYFGLADT